MTDLKAHPVADLFPMMGDAELAELADDIRANGLRHPIVLKDGVILDGRNRYRACRLADVEPTYEEANGSDPLALVVSLNVKRRNLSAGQRAIAAAEAWEQVEQKGKRAKNLAQLFGVNNSYVSQARALVERDPLAAEAVKTGALALTEAYEALREREGQVRGSATDHRRLKETFPDLADAVDSEVKTLREALAEAEQRAAKEKQARWAATSNLLDGLAYLDASVAPEAVRQTVALIDHDLATQSGREISPERLRRAAAYALALADAMENEQ